MTSAKTLLPSKPHPQVLVVRASARLLGDTVQATTFPIQKPSLWSGEGVEPPQFTERSLYCCRNLTEPNPLTLKMRVAVQQRCPLGARGRAHSRFMPLGNAGQAQAPGPLLQGGKPQAYASWSGAREDSRM